MSDPKPMSRSEARMLEQAARNGWKVPADTKERAVGKLDEIISDPELSARDKIAAIKALVAMNGQNIAIEKDSGSIEISGGGMPSITIVMPEDREKGAA